jgi:hypothetical protein
MILWMLLLSIKLELARHLFNNMSIDEILFNYNKAYDKLVHCAENEYEVAEKELQYWRHLFFR